MTKEAEANATEDAEKKEKIEIRNQADSLIFTAEKSLKDGGDKVPEDVKKEVEEVKDTLSVWDSIRLCVKSRYLSLLAWITIADYVAYALGEVIFLDALKQKFPDPCDYCAYNGQLSLWTGILTAFSALVITPYLLHRCRWVVASLVTPACLLLTEGAFFLAIWHPSTSHKIELLVFLGTLFYCLVRAAKSTLFDTSKEISFIPLPPLEKMQGKLVIDGMCSRLGRGSASVVSITLIQACGGVLASASAAGLIVLTIAVSCVMSTFKLGKLVEKKSALKKTDPSPNQIT